MQYFLGIDIGSTTAKVVLTDGTNILFQAYERHFSQVREKLCEILKNNDVKSVTVTRMQVPCC